MLIDDAMDLTAGLVQAPNEGDRVRAYRKAYDVYSAYGWTGIHNMSVDGADVPVMEALATNGEATSLRVYNAVVPEAATALFATGPRNAADGLVVTRAVKFYVDGALGSRGAALHEPYADAPHTRGLVRLTPEQALPDYQEALRRGIQIATHAIGDRGNTMVLDWYDQAYKAVPAAQRRIADPRWRIEHAQVVRPNEIPRFAKGRVIASMQPSHAIGDLHFAPARLGMDRLKGAYAWDSMLKAGATVVGGSDAPVERGDPLIEFYAAVARKDLKGFSGPGWGPEEAVNRAQALKMFTAWPAYAAFMEKELGTIERGKRADLSVFSVDLMTAPVADIPKGEAMLTVVNGRIAHRAAGW
jgi:hypothetical protein